MPSIPSPPFTRANATALYERGLRHVCFQEFKLASDMYDELYNVDGSVKSTETDAVVAGLGTFPLKGEGQAPTFDNIVQAYTKVYTHLTYALGYKITWEARSDELYGVTARMFKELGRMAAVTQAILRMAPFNNSSATQYAADGTNYPMLSLTHYRQDGGTWSNKLSSGADLDRASLEAGLLQWDAQMVDLRGNKTMTLPKYLLVGIDDRFQGQRLLNSILQPGTALNDTNPLHNLGLKLIVSKHMTNDGRWYLIGDPSETTLQWWNRTKLTVDNETEGVGSGNLLEVAKFRVSSGLTTPAGLFGSL